LLLTVALLLAFLPARVDAERSNIVKLSKFNFGEHVKNGAWLVKFYRRVFAAKCRCFVVGWVT
jgi:hypothetical protein